MSSFTSISPPSVQIANIFSTFTTLSDSNDEVGQKNDLHSKDPLNNTMITPPMSQGMESSSSTPADSTPPSSPGSGSSRIISRNEFVDSLISLASLLLEDIWSESFNSEQIKWFLKETLRRSRSSYCALQVSLYYIHKMRKAIKHSGRGNLHRSAAVFSCPKRCFLTCLILASKFLQDRNYSMKTWAKISGLPLKELISMEMEVLMLMDHNLNVNNFVYSEWSKSLLICTYISNSSKGKTAASRTGDEMEQFSKSDKTFLTTLSFKERQLAQILNRFDKRVSPLSFPEEALTDATSLTRKRCIDDVEGGDNNDNNYSNKKLATN